MQPFFVRTLERKLKGAFICGSASGVDNPTVNALRAPFPTCDGRCVACVLRPALAALLVTALALPGAHASDHRDHERARAAMQAGEVLPLQTLLERLQRTHPGQVLELELEREDGRWVYEVKLLQAGGQLLKLDLDAGSGEVLQSRRRDKGKDDRPSDRRAEPAKQTAR